MAQQQNYRVESWLSRLIERRGEEYITSGRLTIDEVSKNAEKIVDDMIKGRIDYNKYGQIILNPVILDTILNYCISEINHKNALHYSLAYTYNDYLGNRIMHVPSNYACTLQAFGGDQINGPSFMPASMTEVMATNISQAIGILAREISILNIVKNALETVSATNNPYALYTLANKLLPYTKPIKKF